MLVPVAWLPVSFVLGLVVALGGLILLFLVTYRDYGEKED